MKVLNEGNLLTWPQYPNIQLTIIVHSVFNQLSKVNLSPQLLSSLLRWPGLHMGPEMALYSKLRSQSSGCWVGDNLCLRLSPHSKMQCSILMPPTWDIKVHWRPLIGWHWWRRALIGPASQLGNRWKLNSSGKSLHYLCSVSSYRHLAVTRAPVINETWDIAVRARLKIAREPH